MSRKVATEIPRSADPMTVFGALEFGGAESGVGDDGSVGTGCGLTLWRDTAGSRVATSKIAKPSSAVIIRDAFLTTTEIKVASWLAAIEAVRIAGAGLRLRRADAFVRNRIALDGWLKSEALGIVYTLPHANKVGLTACNKVIGVIYAILVAATFANFYADIVFCDDVANGIVFWTITLPRIAGLEADGSHWITNIFVRTGHRGGGVAGDNRRNLLPRESAAIRFLRNIHGIGCHIHDIGRHIHDIGRHIHGVGCSIGRAVGIVLTIALEGCVEVAGSCHAQEGKGKTDSSHGSPAASAIMPPPWMGRAVAAKVCFSGDRVANPTIPTVSPTAATPAATKAAFCQFSP
jgi:hypothetical protein